MDNLAGVVPSDSPLGLPHAALRPWGVLALAAGVVASGLIAGWRGRGLRLGSGVLALTLAGLALRGINSLVQDGGLYDVFDAYRTVGDQLRRGGDLFVEPALGLANYPPVIYWWWAAAAAVPSTHPHLYAALVRLPYWVADAAVAPLLLIVMRRAGGAAARQAGRAAWMYAVSPVAIAVPTLHGQFDALVVLPLVAAISVIGRRPGLAGALTGLAIAVKPWPVFFAAPLLALVPRPRWRGLVAGAVGVPLAAFALYGALHPAHLLQGIQRVATYVPHRQGLGTSLLLPERAPAAVTIAANLAAAAMASIAGVMAVRRKRVPGECLAVAMLVLLALSPTVSDQYLMWPLPFLLLAGRLGLVALLTAGLTPAVAALDLWTAQDDGGPPVLLLVVASLSMGMAAVHLLRRRGPVECERGRLSGGLPAELAAGPAM